MSTPADPALTLLTLLASGASAAELSAVDAPEARALALRVRAAFDTRRRREAELSALVDTARDLASMRDPAGVLDAIVRRARTLLQTDVAYLTLADPEAGDTYMRATDGSVSARFQTVRLSLGAGLGGLVASTHMPYWTADYPHDQRFRHTETIDSAVGDEGLVAICGTPLLVEEQFVGVLFAANRSPRPFSHDEVSLLGSLAALAAVSIVTTRAAAETAEALAALSEAHDVARRHVSGVERAAAAHDRFAELVLQGGGVDDITAALVELLGGWAVLLDPDGTRVGTAGRAAPRPPANGCRDPLAGAPAVLATHASGRLATEDGVWAVSVTAAHERLGTLVVGGVGRLDEADERTLERAGVVSALVLLFERAAVDASLRVVTDLVSDLVSGRGDAPARQTRARAHGLDLAAPHCVLVVKGREGESRRALVLSAQAGTGPGSVVGEHDGDVVALVPAEDPDAAATHLATRLSRSAPVTVGAAGPVRSVEELPAAHAEARRTAAALIALGRLGAGASTEALGFAGLVVGSDPDVASYVARILGPVSAYDAQRGSELVKTLETYFAAGSSPRHAATALHVHVNTVAQRLERVATLLGSDWQHPDRALELQLALRLRRLMPAD
ncbi:MAG TPA: helix-turn-helix domain-containing protein [Oryzihumus sp.]|nr:helix-turn-helix domain-containing protein [Oryzihumus sp.]